MSLARTTMFSCSPFLGSSLTVSPPLAREPLDRDPLASPDKRHNDLPERGERKSPPRWSSQKTEAPPGGRFAAHRRLSRAPTPALFPEGGLWDGERNGILDFGQACRTAMHQLLKPSFS